MTGNYSLHEISYLYETPVRCAMSRQDDMSAYVYGSITAAQSDKIANRLANACENIHSEKLSIVRNSGL